MNAHQRMGCDIGLMHSGVVKSIHIHNHCSCLHQCERTAWCACRQDLLLLKGPQSTRVTRHLRQWRSCQVRHLSSRLSEPHPGILKSPFLQSSNIDLTGLLSIAARTSIL